MSRDAEIVLRMGASLCIQESIGRWDNSVTYVDMGGNEESCQYSIQVFADYRHAFYHLGIGISRLSNGFEEHAEHIRCVGQKIASDVSERKLSSVPMHFSGLVLVGADKIDINEQTLVQRFSRLGMAIRVYDTSADDMPAIVPQILLTPEDAYSERFQDCKIHYQTPDYLVWEEADGAVCYSLQMRLRGRFQDERSVLRDISRLSPKREKVTRYLHSKRDRKRISSGMASVLRDALEGKIDDASKTLGRLESEAFKNSLNRAKALTMLTSFGVVGLTLVTLILSSGVDNPEFIGPVWGMIGAALALWIPMTRLNYLAEYSWDQVVIDVLARVVIGGIAGSVVIFLVKSKVLLGFVDAESSGLIYVISLVAGWSERFLPKIFGQFESKILSEKRDGGSSGGQDENF
ncbi:hypothetical protein [Halomonas denitrificans]|uniref:hypothetical protein n=1 Tax=Halomonas denitrificans TaxID=370769 RepID=UPI001C9A14C2|nr:hypothetical protein [Halomonas denitrificans]MBY5970576.1 hypothetical protein [Halomonas denitrificans]